MASDKRVQCHATIKPDLHTLKITTMYLGKNLYAVLLTIPMLFGNCSKKNSDEPTNQESITVTANRFQMTPVPGSFNPNTAGATILGSDKQVYIQRVNAGNENATMTFGNTDIIKDQSVFVPAFSESVGMKNVSLPNSIQLKFLSDGHTVTLTFDANTQLYLGSQNPADYNGADAHAKFKQNLEAAAAKFTTIPIKATFE